MSGVSGVISAFVAGLLFAAGLVVGGMTLPSKVVGFLDFAGSWDPSLVFVMGGAVAVHTLAFRLITRRKAPLFETRFMIPTRKDLTAPLVIGAGIFGVGWGLGGYCPGPGLVSLPTGGVEPLGFVAGMTGGFVLFRVYDQWRASQKSEPTPSPAS